MLLSIVSTCMEELAKIQVNQIKGILKTYGSDNLPQDCVLCICWYTLKSFDYQSCFLYIVGVFFVD